MDDILTVSSRLEQGEDLLASAGCDTPHADAAAIIAHALGVEPDQLQACANQPVPEPLAMVIATKLSRRAAREPLAYILGYCRFRDLDLMIDSRALIPNPASGVLVELAHQLPRGSSVHDVGTGSGAIALAILHERPDLKVSGSDISAAAIQVACANAAKLDLPVTFDVLPWLPEGYDYDLVIANLPYVDRDLRSMYIPPEYTDYQPHVAVYSGGHDGLAIIREFVARLDITGLLALQHAPSQTDEVRSFFVDPETRFGRTTFGCLKPRPEGEGAQVWR